MWRQFILALFVGAMCCSCDDPVTQPIAGVLLDAGPSAAVLPDTGSQNAVSCTIPGRPKRFMPGRECPTSQSYVADLILPIDPKEQLCPKWCWASSISMLAEYNGLSTTACSVASRHTGLDCCGMNPCERTGCDEALKSKDVAGVLAEYDIVAEHLTRPLTEQELRHELWSYRPVLVALDLPESQHMIVISGLNAQGYRLLDPDGNIHVLHPQFLSYAALVHGTKNMKWKWTSSWRVASDKLGLCSMP